MYNLEFESRNDKMHEIIRENTKPKVYIIFVPILF